MKPRFRRSDGLLEDRLPNREIELDGVDERPIQVPASRRLGGRVRHDQRLGIGLLSLGQGPRCIQPIDVGLRPDGDRERDGVDANPFGAQQPGFADSIAKVCSPVADDDNVLAAVVRKEGASELQRGREVGVVRVGLALKLAELGVLTDVDLDLRIAAEAEHAGAIISAALLQDPPDCGGFVVERALDAGRQVRGDQ